MALTVNDISDTSKRSSSFRTEKNSKQSDIENIGKALIKGRKEKKNLIAPPPEGSAERCFRKKQKHNCLKKEIILYLFDCLTAGTVLRR